tara:strand:+ start:72 stop:266 length:195 start_codon:yes stop_codon:yes gene_type:complete
MTKYTCNNCNKKKEITRVKLIYLEKEKEWVVEESLCSCGSYMDSKPVEGFPNLIRTEDSLTKKN